jgi:glycosyltransferase involved in cell wall biosynthesis
VRVLTTDANGSDSDLEVNTRESTEISPGLFVRYCHRIADVSVSPALLRLLVSHVSWADVVHLMAVYSFPTIPTLLACRILGKPLVWSPRGMLQRWDGTKRPHLKAIWESVCRVTAPGRLVLHATSEEEAHESECRLRGVRTVVIPNGVDIPPALANRNGHPARRFIYLGRLHPKKGIENLLLAYKLVQDKLRGSSLVIAGEGDPPYVESLKAEIQRLGLAETVKIIGHVAGNAKEEFFKAADVLIVPSYTENFGLVVAEALAHAVPVIVSRGTPWRRVEEIGCGLWVENEPESLAAAIERISMMPVREMGLKGREWMQTEFDWNALARGMVGVYHNLLSTSW